MKNQEKRSRVPKILLGVVALMAVTAVVGAACGGSGDGSTQQAGDTQAVAVAHEEGHGPEEADAPHDEDAALGHQAVAIEGTPEVTLTTTEWAFGPETMTVKLGEPVTIVLVNDGYIEHDVEVAAFGLHLHAQPGAVMKGSFVPDRVGTFEFVCTIAGHKEAGMEGTLVVTE